MLGICASKQYSTKILISMRLKYIKKVECCMICYCIKYYMLFIYIICYYCLSFEILIKLA